MIAAPVLDEDAAAGDAAEFGKGRGDAGLYRRTGGDRLLKRHRHGGDEIDELAVEKDGRPGRHLDGDVLPVLEEAQDDVPRRIGAAAERVGEREADQRRGIVEEDGERDFHPLTGGAVDVGVEVGAGQSVGGFRTLRGGGLLEPADEVADDQKLPRASSREPRPDWPWLAEREYRPVW